jgi:hypothetical protein
LQEIEKIPEVSCKVFNHSCSHLNQFVSEENQLENHAQSSRYNCSAQIGLWFILDLFRGREDNVK